MTRGNDSNSIEVTSYEKLWFLGSCSLNIKLLLWTSPLLLWPDATKHGGKNKTKTSPVFIPATLLSALIGSHKERDVNELRGLPELFWVGGRVHWHTYWACFAECQDHKLPQRKSVHYSWLKCSCYKWWSMSCTVALRIQLFFCYAKSLICGKRWEKPFEAGSLEGGPETLCSWCCSLGILWNTL